ncbi:hypothetical protein BJ993_004322 [Nocardioides aromaticivorans]|uniref:DUF3352 domain-containing protein n=1 Tax=Nocardioides aromaticivorans TaxID=200618 RepID=A0A7Y9ZKQ8_9ACTN|nr:hypothetical protein [Nocardioides aromaticivorans]NYI47242.1 hypothetical protein [Nocardioides aromaticivorans]
MTLADAVPLPPTEPRRPRRRAAAIAGIVGVAAVVGGGAWAWQVWAAQGPQPAEALPADTLAYVAVDLDPPGGQKVAAYRALKRIPSLAKELGIGSQDDLRKSLVESIAEDGGCDLPWREVEDWAGDRGALAVVPLEEPALVVALQVSDPDGARRGLAKVADSCGDDEFGFTVGDGWAILAESDEIAEQVRADAEDADLAGDQDFKELTGATGDPGVVTLYAAPEAGQALLDVSDGFPFFLFAAGPLGSLDPVSAMVTAATVVSDFSSVIEEDLAGQDAAPEMSPEEEALWDRMDRYDELTRAEQKEFDKELTDYYERQYGDLEDGGSGEGSDGDEEDFFEIPAETRKALEDFSGLGGTVRFDDGGVELDVVADPFLTGYDGIYDDAGARDAIAGLPADTVVAFGGGLADGWAERALTRNQLLLEQEGDELIASFEKATGLSPADLEDLGGDAIAFAAGDGFERFVDDESVEDLPIAVRVTGDPERIEAALAKLRGTKELSELLGSERTDDGLVIGPSPSYLAELVDPDETLGDSGRFEDALPDADDAVALAYTDLGAGHWLETLSEGDLTAKDVDSLATLGGAVSKEGDRYRVQLRLAFD